MPSLLSAVSAALQATSSSVTAAAAAAAAGNKVSLAGLMEDAQEAVRQARQQLDSATATLGTANQKVCMLCLIAGSTSGSLPSALS